MRKQLAVATALLTVAASAGMPGVCGVAAAEEPSTDGSSQYVSPNGTATTLEGTPQGLRIGWRPRRRDSV